MDHRPLLVAPEQLLAEHDWLIRLARSLVASSDDADDLAQEALTAALAHPPAAERPLRPWLAHVAKNLSIRFALSRARRVRRERDVARGEEQPSAAEIVEQVALQRAVVEAVLELEEPYRSTVLLRYWEDLPPRAIAARLRVPVETVRTRLKRGLARLREALDRRSGGRNAWLGALLPLAGRTLVHGSAGALATGVLVMSTQSKVLIATLALLAVGWIGFRTVVEVPSTQGAAVEPALSGTSAAPEVARESPSASAVEGPSRVAVAIESVHPRAPLESATPAATLSGIAIDVQSNPVPALEIELSNSGHEESLPPLRTVSDFEGRFQLEARSSGTLGTKADVWVAVFEPQLRQGHVGDYVLVVARKHAIDGSVVDESGMPIPDAEIGINSEHGRSAAFQSSLTLQRLHAAIRLPLDDSVPRAWIARSDARGCFTIADAPAMDLVIDVKADGFRPTQKAIRIADAQPVVVVLARPAEGKNLLSGTVIRDDGSPLAAASVILGSASCSTGEDGTFALELARATANDPLVALHAGWAPVIQPCPTSSPASPEAWPQPLVLQFRQRIGALSGRVVDENGQGLANVDVQALDGTSWSELAEACPQLAGFATRHSGLGTAGSVATDAEGKFALELAVDRPTRLRALDPVSRAWVATGAFAPGTAGIEIALAVNAGRISVRGRVLDPRGEPISGAKVAAVRRIPEPGSSELRSTFAGSAVATNGAGYFVLDGVQLPIDRISVQTEALGPGEELSVTASNDLAALELVVGRLGYVRVEIPKGGIKADSIAMLDSAGNRLQLGSRRGNGGWIGGQTMPLIDGNSEPLMVSETARFVLLLKNNSVVVRLPVRVESAKVVTVGP